VSSPIHGALAGPIALGLALALIASAAGAQTVFAAPADHVAQTERDLARTMADRDHAGFVGFLSEQAIFFDGASVMRGRAAVAAAWKPLFEGSTAPFSWAPDLVEVLADGSLAHSSGLVRDPQGRPIARFNSVWRLESGGVWRIVFDKGSPLTDADRHTNATAAATGTDSSR
jgi:ketosteroid isomerase-like protein